MSTKRTLSELESVLNIAITDDGESFNAEILDGEIAVLQVTMAGREEFPIFITIDDSQILCVSYLWKEYEIDPNQREELFDMMLTMNIPMPLSAFSKVGSQYLIFGALANVSNVDAVIHEVEVLSDNTLEVVESFSDYMKS